jgi:hypothetical protein
VHRELTEIDASRRAWAAVRYLKQVAPVLLSYGLLVIPAILLPRLGQRPDRTTAELALGHALLCLGVGLAMHFVELVLQPFDIARRFRLRAPIFVGALMVWPLLVITIGLVFRCWAITR